MSTKKKADAPSAPKTPPAAKKDAAPKKDPAPKKAKADKATPKKAAKDKAPPAEKKAEAPPPEPVEAEPIPEPEPERFAREALSRSEDEAKTIRGLLKKASKALENIEEVFDAFDPAPSRPVKNAIKKLADEIELLRPPEPRKCKEYKRALGLAKKGEMGIHPDDVMRFCRCGECAALRDKAGVPHPLAPRSA